MNSTFIKQRLQKSLFNNYNYILCNTYIFGWESDFFAISKSGYSVEVEIKISKSDFKADFNKNHHSGLNKHKYLKEGKLRPHKFYFACPKDLINENEIPSDYGLIYVDGCNIKIVKSAKFLHKEDLFQNKNFLRILLNKFYYRTVSLSIGLQIFESDVNLGQGKLNFRNY